MRERLEPQTVVHVVKARVVDEVRIHPVLDVRRFEADRQIPRLPGGRSLQEVDCLVAQVLRHVGASGHQILPLARPALEVVVAGRGVLNVLGAAHAVLADEAGVVAGVPEPHRIAQRVLLLTQWSSEPVDAMAARVQSGEEGGPGNGADRGRDVVVREHHALARQPVHVGRTDNGVAACADHVVALVVSEEEEDVRRGCGLDSGTTSEA